MRLNQGAKTIDPTQNPDGRDRFIHQFTLAHGLAADPDRISAEHDEPWPGGRTNHYLFDLNRDWIYGVNPESRGRIAAAGGFLLERARAHHVARHQPDLLKRAKDWFGRFTHAGWALEFDGQDDIVLGANGADAGAENSGTSYLVFGRLSGAGDVIFEDGFE